MHTVDLKDVIYIEHCTYNVTITDTVEQQILHLFICYSSQH